MVAYHDEEWGTPVHDDVELFERLALESFQAGLSWSTILRKREAFRAAFAGFDPRLVAAFDERDRARLMADAGIVRNGAKIDATVGNAAALLATTAAFGSFDRYLASIVPGPPAPLPATALSGGIPATTPGFGRAVEGPQGARLPLRRLDHRVRLHAERRARRRSRPGLLSLPRLTRADSQVAALEPPGRRTQHERDPHDRPGDEDERRRLGGVERVGRRRGRGRVRPR